MDILRVIGGTPVVRVPALSIQSLTVNNAGSGYLDQNNQARGLEIIIGDPSDPGGGAQVDMSKVVFDTNGGLVELPLLSGGRMYSPENPPTITVKGLGKNARVSAKFADEKPVERVAKFIITQVGPNGEPLNFACICLLYTSDAADE